MTRSSSVIVCSMPSVCSTVCACCSFKNVMMSARVGGLSVTASRVSVTHMSDQPHQSKTSTLAIVALVFTVLCMPAIGFVLGIIALVRINNSKGALTGTVLAAVAVGL